MSEEGAVGAEVTSVPKRIKVLGQDFSFAMLPNRIASHHTVVHDIVHPIPKTKEKVEESVPIAWWLFGYRSLSSKRKIHTPESFS